MSLTTWLPLLILLSSLVPGIAIFLLREESHLLRTLLNMSGAILKLVFVGILIWGVFHDQMIENRWTLAPGLDLVLHADALSVLFVSLSTLLWLVTTIYAIGYLENAPHRSRFFGFFSLCVTATVGLALAGNLFTFVIFYEMLTLSTYPLVSHKGDEKTVRSARVYLGILISASIGLLLPAIIWTYSVAGTGDFTMGGILRGHIDGPQVGLLLGLFVFGAAKAAVMPVHRWLPAAMVAPTPVSALLHAVAVVKAGVFTIVKIIVYVFGVDFLFSEPSSGWLFWAAAFTIIAASVVALRQQNLKRLLAYSTVAQLSYVVMASAILKPLAEVGAAMHMLAHSFGKITLFFAAGSIYTA